MTTNTSLRGWQFAYAVSCIEECPSLLRFNRISDLPSKNTHTMSSRIGTSHNLPYKIIDYYDVWEDVELTIIKNQESFGKERNIRLAIPALMIYAQWNNYRLREILNGFNGLGMNFEDAFRVTFHTVIDHSNSLHNFTYIGNCHTCKQKVDIRCLSCSHGLCASCWNKYIEDEVYNGKLNIRCPKKGCGITFALEQLFMLMDKHVAALYRRKLCEFFINCHTKKYIKCCSNNCQKVYEIKNPTSNLMTLACNCGNLMCIRCRCPAHPFAQCEMIQNWHKTIKNESEELLLHLNCPECQLSIGSADPEKEFLGCHNCALLFCWGCKEILTDEKLMSHRCEAIKTPNDERRILSCLQNWIMNVKKQEDTLNLLLRFQFYETTTKKSSSRRNVLDLIYNLLQSRFVLVSMWIIMYNIKTDILQWSELLENLSSAAECMTILFENQTYDNWNDDDHIKNLSTKLFQLDHDISDYYQKAQSFILLNIRNGTEEVLAGSS